MAVKRASAFFALVLCAEAILSAPLELKVVGDRVNLRARPVFDADVAGQVSTGASLIAPEGIPEGAEWVKVRPPESVDLWIFSALVRDGVVTADDTYVRCGPGQHYKPVGKVGKGFRVEPRGAASGDWLRIAPVPTAELYISSAFVLAVPSAEAAPQEEGGPDATARTVPSSQSSVPSPQPPAPQTDQPPDLPIPQTDQPPARPIVQIPAPQTDQPSAAQTDQRAKEQAVQRFNGSTVQRLSDSPSVPAAIAGCQLAPGPRQGEVVTIRGRLERLSLAKAPGFTRYQLVDKAGSSRSAAICRVIGLQGQWHELAGSEIEIEGRLWTLSDSVPVVDASRVRRIASWDK